MTTVSCQNENNLCCQEWSTPPSENSSFFCVQSCQNTADHRRPRKKVRKKKKRKNCKSVSAKYARPKSSQRQQPLWSAIIVFIEENILEVVSLANVATVSFKYTISTNTISSFWWWHKPIFNSSFLSFPYISRPSTPTWSSKLKSTNSLIFPVFLSFFLPDLRFPSVP